jgi:hypothetical protein
VSETTQRHIQRFSTLRTERSNWDNQWEEAAALVLPMHRDSFLARGMTNGIGMGGQKKTEAQFDATAAFAVQRFSSVIESLVTPQNSRWHNLKPVDAALRKNRAARLFFDDLTDMLFNYRYRPVANFVGNSQQSYLGMGAYGNGALFIDQPDNARGLRYRNMHLGETYFAENHAGIVDTVYRCFWLTARQIIQQFGRTAVPEAITAAADQPTQADKKFEILHCVYPSTDYDPTRLDALGRPYASLYILVQDQSLLQRDGYHSFPYAIARYTQASGEIYGRGPAQWVLPSIKVINEQKKTMLRQGHRAVEPVYLTHDDGILGNFSVKPGSNIPGGMNKDGKPLVGTLPVGNVNLGDKMMEMERNIINDAFLITLFQILIDTPQMTATEVLERAKEKGLLLAPTAGRMQAEFLGPMIERELSVMAAQGLWPRVPSILQNVEIEYRVEYDSPMSRMQRAEKASGFMHALNVAAEYAKNTQDPSPLDWFNFDEAMPEIIDIQGAPTSWTRSLEEVKALREQRSQAQQQQQMLDAAPAMASVVKGAPNLVQ